MAYLGGFIETDGQGIPRKRYYAEKSSEGQFCRAALARVLRSNRPLDQQLRDMLAAMFDPSPEAGSVRSERVLLTYFRKKPKDHIADTHKALFVWERLKAGTVNAAVEEAAAHFEDEREYIYRLWKVYKPKFERYTGQSVSANVGEPTRRPPCFAGVPNHRSRYTDGTRMAA
jgi:hypothetical protein